MDKVRHTFGTTVGLVLAVLFTAGTLALILSLASDRLPALKGIGTELRCFLGIPAAGSQCVLDQVNALHREREEVARERDALARQMAEHRERQQQLAAMEQQVSNYSMFQAVDLPFGEVTTGTRFASVLRPEEWTTSWCYMNRANRSALSLRVDIGRRDFGQPVRWDRHTEAQLREARLTREQIEAAQAACRFPEG